MDATDLETWFGDEGIGVLRNVGIGQGHVVLDFGCGEGYYAIPAATLVGPAGRVFALDRDRRALAQLMLVAETRGVSNIVPLFGELATLRVDLEDESVDTVLLYDVLHYMSGEERGKVYREAHRVLKTGAVLSVCPKHHKLDWPMWELADLELHDLVNEIENAGFCLEQMLHRRLVHFHAYEMGDILLFSRGPSYCGQAQGAAHA
jgi:ubiquinone/menaquinone biosynthesis C-methylase UbiE